jgi:hypothetical protein
MGRRPYRFDRLPQNGEKTDQKKADKPKTAPAIQSGRPTSRDSGGSTAAISIVLPAPIAIRQKNNRKNAPRRSGRDRSGGSLVPSLMPLHPPRLETCPDRKTIPQGYPVRPEQASEQPSRTGLTCQ